VLDDADNILQAWVPTAPGYVFAELDPADITAVEYDEICNR
jgi:hypothetical protein